MPAQRPSKAQFLNMPIAYRKALVRPLAPGGVPFPTLTGAQLHAARLHLGLTHQGMSNALGINRPRGADMVKKWEEGNVRRHGRHALVPGKHALTVKNLLEKAAQGA